MMARTTMKRELVALWCLAAAAGCAKVAEEAVTDATAAGEPATPPAPLVVQAPVAIEAVAPDPARFESPDSLADGRTEAVENAPAASSPAPDTLDVAALLTRLRKTKAINLRTKLAVKNESDDLLERFRAYHARHGTATLDELRRSYDALFLKLYVLLRDADPPLARDIDRSRGAIWATLADPLTFGASAPTRSKRDVPPA